jgi:S-sulfo-L-cysteine synthase (O-acetyl-L-serine-dependent)
MRWFGKEKTQEPALWNAVGNTPLFPVQTHLGERPLYLKAEWLNPGGSVKDRAARAILRDGLCRGELPAKRLLDASSGNTGIAYAMLGAAAGIDVTICLPGNASPERRALLEIYGAEVVLTDRLAGTDGAVERALELVAEYPDRYFYADQYSNPANPRAHRETTGPEIWTQTEGRVTHFVAALGTTGTMMGTGGFLKERNPRVQLVGVQPDSPLHGLEGLKHLSTTAHLPALYDSRLPDRVVEIATEVADRTARNLARTTGYLVGWSAGAAVAAGLEIARRDSDACVVVVGCDTGSRYLSEPHRWTAA